MAVLVVVAATRSNAQDTARAGSVGGTVFDSVARQPVAGALVQLVAKNSPAGTVYSGESDARGRYEIRNVPPGYYLIGFLHPALDSLTVSPPVRAVDVMAGARSVANLAVPSPTRVVAALCGAAPADTLGAMFGVMRDARTRLPVDSGTIFASWSDFVISTGGSRIEQHTIHTSVGAAGMYALCGLAPSGDAIVFAVSGADSTGAVGITLPENGLMRRDFLIGGQARVHGVVTNGSRPLPNVHVAVSGQEHGTESDSSGAFRLDVRAGTQTLELKAIGFVPERFPVSLEADRDTALNVALTSLKKMMDTIKVVAERRYWADRGGFSVRKRQGIGFFVDENDIAKHATFDVVDALHGVPSIRVVGFGMFKKVIMTKNDGSPCVPSLFLDGFRMQLGPADLDNINPKEIGGIEVYRGSAETPVQFQNLDGCGTIVVWTRPPRPTRIR